MTHKNRCPYYIKSQLNCMMSILVSELTVNELFKLEWNQTQYGGSLFCFSILSSADHTDPYHLPIYIHSLRDDSGSFMRPVLSCNPVSAYKVNTNPQLAKCALTITKTLAISLCAFIGFAQQVVSHFKALFAQHLHSLRPFLTSHIHLGTFIVMSATLSVPDGQHLG